MNKDKVSNGTALAAEQAKALVAILEQRSGSHGDALENLNDIARRWTHVISKKMEVLGYHSSKEVIKLDASDVAYMMVEMKLSRATYGDSQEVDHFRDIMGYAAIGAAQIETQSKK